MEKILIRRDHPIMNIQRIRLALLATVLMGALVLIGCGAPPESQGPPLNPQVTPLTGPEAAGNMAIKSNAGVLPCGVFNVNGFGPKRVPLASFSGCSAASYRVLCLNDKAQWIGDNVSDVALSVDKTRVDFTSAQDGVCGLFPAQ
jgi:hypothetical protein